jgi:two-component system NtrC family sensor kinase
VTTIHHANAETHVKHMERLEAENHALRERLATAEQSTAHGERTSELQVENQALRQQLLHSQRLAALGTMTAMVAHEFNNSLTPVINYAQLAQKNPSFSGKAVDRAADGGQRAADICKAILGLAREQQATPVTVGVAELVHETILAMGRDFHRDGIDVVLDVPQGLSFCTRKVELQQVLLNLLLNARAAVLAKSGTRRIDISARCTRGRLTLKVRDSGVGIPPENLSRIFKPFFTTKSDDGDGSGNGGHGLGLSICSDILKSLDGRIDVQSVPGQGATFTVDLPA